MSATRFWRLLSGRAAFRGLSQSCPAAKRIKRGRRRGGKGSQRRPVLVDAFVLDVFDLVLADAELLRDQAAGAWRRVALVLNAHQGQEDGLPSLQVEVIFVDRHM